MTTATIVTTPEERREMYDSISRETKAPVLVALIDLLEPVAGQIKADYVKDSLNWWKRGHFHFGLAVRNQLRRTGFDAKYFGVENLDDIYVYLVEDALQLHE
jgi:hypothetical protein